MGSIMFVAGAISGASLLLGAVHYHLAGTGLYLAGYLLALAALTGLLRWASGRAVRKRLGGSHSYE